MPYEDDYKMWLEDMFIKMNPDWLCDGMADKEFTHDWCEKYCGKDSDYITPKCLHIYYHHIARADRNSSEKPNNCEHITEDGCADRHGCKTEPTISKMEQVEPQTCSFSDCDNFKNPDYERCIECKRKQIKLKTEQTERSE